MNDDDDDRPEAVTMLASADGLQFVPRHHSVWTEKYRPKSIPECVLPSALKNPLLNYVAQGGGPHLLLVGPPGVGKSTVGRALGQQLGWYTLVVNGAVHSTAMRGDVAEIATGGLGLYLQRKCILLDEADRMSVNAQCTVHGWLEDHDGSCTFVFTTNHPEKIGAPPQIPMPDARLRLRDRTGPE